MSLISIVVPVYHNAGSLPDLLEAFRKLAARNSDDTFEFVFVDDGSTDNSLAVLTELAGHEARMRVVKLSRNFGSNAAIFAGLSQARGDAVAVIAADLQDPPALIHDMLAHWRAGTKVVLAARESREDPFLTALISDLFYSLFRRFAIRTMPPHGFDFFVIDRQVCNLVLQIEENNAYLMGLILWLGFEPTTLHYTRRAREKRYGSSMWTLAKKIKYFIDAFVAFSYAPVRMASLMGVTFSIFGLIYAAVILVLRFTVGFDQQGWASTMLVLLVASGTQLLTIGVLGEYMWRNLDETRKRPRFVIDRVIEPNDAPEG